MHYIIKNLGLTHYATIWDKMREFTETRNQNTPDELWILEHHPVFTQGLACKDKHLLNSQHDIPIIKCDRGGQITYHAPGQIIIYTLIDLKRLKISIRDLVERLENGIINYLDQLGIEAYSDKKAPGVYIANKKIASLGLKVRKGCTYHGISFNASLDLKPFNYINVCGYTGLKVTKLQDFIQDFSMQTTKEQLSNNLIKTIFK